MKNGPDRPSVVCAAFCADNKRMKQCSVPCSRKTPEGAGGPLSGVFLIQGDGTERIALRAKREFVTLIDR
jgi:hypothetical protein